VKWKIHGCPMLQWEPKENKIVLEKYDVSILRGKTSIKAWKNRRVV
jgi:hypothetical protein